MTTPESTFPKSIDPVDAAEPDPKVQAAITAGLQETTSHVADGAEATMNSCEIHVNLNGKDVPVRASEKPLTKDTVKISPHGVVHGVELDKWKKSHS
jgi:hypothetical protein